jgi:integrase
MGSDGRRRTLRLGKANQRAADAMKIRVETLLAAAASRTPLDNETATWLGSIDDKLHDRMARVGLVAGRKQRSRRLEEFLDQHIAERTDVKPNSTAAYRGHRHRLVRHFGAERDIGSITQADADRFVIWMKGEYSGPTVARTLIGARTLFKAAVRAEIITRNPFDGIKAGAQQTNKERQFFVTRPMVEALLAAAPNAEWRAVIALSRFGGLRCTSETLAMKWANIDWAGDRFLVESPKTEHHPDGASRLVPLFPELRVILQEAFELAEDGAVYVVSTYQNHPKNLRPHLEHIIKRAGLTQWPRIFHNMRASRQTELEETFPTHVVCAWLGNSPTTARKHYLFTTEEHFERAVKCDAKSDARATHFPTLQASAATSGCSHEDFEGFELEGLTLAAASRCEHPQFGPGDS